MTKSLKKRDYQLMSTADLRRLCENYEKLIDAKNEELAELRGLLGKERKDHKATEHQLRKVTKELDFLNEIIHKNLYRNPNN